VKLLRKLRALLRKDSLDREMSDEMRHHLELQIEENIAAGMNPDEARYLAQRQFGGVEQIKEQARDIRRWIWLEQLLQDLGYAGRMLRKSPGFTAIAVITLALGIGVSTAMFSVIYGVLLSPYPYAKPSEIWTFRLENAKTQQGIGRLLSDYSEIVKLPCVEVAMATGFEKTMVLSDDTNLELLDGGRFSGSAFPFLGVPPVVGRVFTHADFKSDGSSEPVTVISFRLWQRLFSGKADAIGQTIILDHQPYAIIGVLPERFGWYGRDLWLPLSLTMDQRRWVDPFIRLKPGVSKEVAEQQLRALYQRLAKESPERFPKDGFALTLHSFTEAGPDRWGTRSSLQLLFCAVGLLLLIACTNVANLQLARGAGRGREMAVRLAIGASRGRLIRQVLTESVVLSVLAGIAGLLLAFGLTQLLAVLIPGNNIPREARITINGWVLGYTLGVSLLTGILFGLVPALRSTKADLNEALKDGGHARGLGGPASTRMRNALVVAEVALSVVLLVGASLAIRGFVELQRIDRGYHPERAILVRMRLDEKRYPTIEKRNEFARALLERLRSLPGVRGATIGSIPNMDASTRALVPGLPTPLEDIMLNYVSADYFQTLGIPVVAGRTFTDQEIAHGDHLVVISASTAKRWPAGKNPLGSIIRMDALANGGPEENKAATVIGIVGDTRPINFRSPAQPAAFVPYPLRGPPTADARQAAALARQTERYLMVRSDGMPEAIYHSVRAAVRSIDKDQALMAPTDVGGMMNAMIVAQPRFNMTLFSGLAGIALALAVAGIYSVLSYSVAQRTKEFGVRMALGASRADILRLVLGSGGRLLLIGLVVGIAVSLVLSQVLNSQVFNVPLLDPLALAASAAVLGVASLVACLIPSRRATKVDPMVALRCE
jgi:putative ABC transport system permease protein